MSEAETQEPSHSPLPWRVDKTNALGAYGVWTDAATHPGHDGAGYPSRVCSVYEQNPEIDEPREVRDANAALIVRAVNSHAALVAAAEAAREWLQDAVHDETNKSKCVSMNRLRDQLTAALQAAKEE